eukprot:COSAG01_NODE_27_length_36706_cov_155.674106_24_plen_86_part_00
MMGWVTLLAKLTTRLNAALWTKSLWMPTGPRFMVPLAQSANPVFVAHAVEVAASSDRQRLPDNRRRSCWQGSGVPGSTPGVVRRR